MNAFKALCAALDSPGGHMIMTLGLIFFGFGYLLANPPATAGQLAHDLVVGAIGVFFGAMKGQNGARVSVTPTGVDKQPPSMV